MKTLICMFSYNRYYTLKNALVWLKQYPPKDCDLMVWDDGSTDKELRCKLQRAASGGMVKMLDMKPPRDPAPSKTLADSRCGEQRKRAVDFFMSKKEYDYIFLMDDDILLHGPSLNEAIQDYEMLRSNVEYRVGAITLHAWCGLHGHRPIQNRLFALVKISGESVLLMHRESLEKCGNNFGPQPKGFADTQWRAMRDHGLLYYTRLSPPYQAQHIGVSKGGSVIHRNMPFWVKDCWIDLSTPQKRSKTYIPCPGFDPSWFMNLADLKGCRAACESLYHRMLTRAPSSEVKLVSPPSLSPVSKFPAAEEELTVTVRERSPRGKIVKEIRV